MDSSVKYHGAVYQMVADTKLLILMRGVSGAGKSTKARQLGGEVFSTDDYFTNGYDVAALDAAHVWNQRRVESAMHRSVSPVVVDNTLIQAWEGKPYVDLAFKNRYQIKIMEPDNDLWRQFRPGMPDDELMDLAQQFAQRGRHGAPVEVVFKMLKRWEPNLRVIDIMHARRPQF